MGTIFFVTLKNLSKTQKMEQEAKSEVSPKKDKIENDDQKVEESQKEQETASGSSWWGSYTSMLNKAVDSVSTAVDSVNTVAASAVDSANTYAASAVVSAKQKSTEVYGLVAKDLGEVSTQANSMVRSSSMTLKRTLEWDWYYCDPNLPITEDEYDDDEDKLDEKSDEVADQAFESVKTSVTSAWRYAAGYATQMFTEEDLEAEALLVKDGDQEPVIMNRLQAQLYALASDPATFLSDPDPDDQVEYEKWKCDLDKRQGEISNLMVANANVRKNYSTLVPDKVNHNLFWNRYFFKVHLIELQENKRQQLKARAEASVNANDEEINWDDVADIASNAAIPENVQEKLLKDYEKELRSSAKNKKVSDKEETSSDDWEKLSTGEKSPRKQSKEEDEEWVQP